MLCSGGNYSGRACPPNRAGEPASSLAGTDRYRLGETRSLWGLFTGCRPVCLRMQLNRRNLHACVCAGRWRFASEQYHLDTTGYWRKAPSLRIHRGTAGGDRLAWMGSASDQHPEAGAGSICDKPAINVPYSLIGLEHCRVSRRTSLKGTLWPPDR